MLSVAARSLQQLRLGPPNPCGRFSELVEQLKCAAASRQLGRTKLATVLVPTLIVDGSLRHDQTVVNSKMEFSCVNRGEAHMIVLYELTLRYTDDAAEPFCMKGLSRNKLEKAL